MKKTLTSIASLVLACTLACILTAIPALAFFFNTAGPNLPTAATGSTTTIGGGTRTWTNPTNIELADGTNATVPFLAGAASSADLIGTGFGFAITSTDTISGITLQINYTDTGGAGDVVENQVRILKAGVATATNHSTGATLPASAATVTYGGTADLWGGTFTPADINSTTFGAAFVCRDNVGVADGAGVDFFRITVTSTSAALPAGSQMFKVFSSTRPETHTQSRILLAHK